MEYLGVQALSIVDETVVVVGATYPHHRSDGRCDGAHRRTWLVEQNIQIYPIYTALHVSTCFMVFLYSYNLFDVLGRAAARDDPGMHLNGINAAPHAGG